MNFFNRQRGNVATLLLIISSLLLTSCFYDDTNPSDTSDPLPPNVIELNVYPENLKITQVGSNVTLNIRALDNNSEDVTSALDSIVWQSSDESVATVDRNGLVSVIAVGPVVISATYEEVNGSSSIEVGNSNLNIQGVARYEDAFYGVNGSDVSVENRKKNIRHAIIDLLDVDGNILDTSTTTEQGLFAFGPMIPDKYSIRILAKLDDSYFENIEVADLSGQIYAATFPSTNDEGTPYQLDISQSSSIAGAFNLLDAITVAAEFSKSRLDVTSRDLSVFWEKGHAAGTYYCTGLDLSVCKMGKGIYVLSERSSFPSSDDTDEFDDDIIFHEFSHYLTHSYASDDSEGGIHNLVQNDSDLRLAWSEGWGLFLPSAIKSWISINKPYLLSTTSDTSFYIDTVGSIPGLKRAQISFDINAPSFAINVNGDPAPDSSFHYASSEAAIAKILWDLHESAASGMVLIWDSISVGMMELASPTNLPSFWDGMLSSELSSESDISALEATLNIRQVFYEDDNSEPDDSRQQATLYSVGVTEPITNYLYRGNGGAGDEDYFQFDAESGETYEIRTTDLRNGIDTSISILDVDGNVVTQDGVAFENDDDVDAANYFRYDEGCACRRVINDGVSLASKLIFTPALNGRYTIRVWYSKKFAKKVDSTGHYGTYTLSINVISG